MANNRVNVDISANVEGFVQGMNKASDSVEKYETDIRKVSESTGNFRKEFSQAKKEVLNLAQAYAKLDDEAKASTFGREMARQLNEAKEKAAQMTDMMGDIQAELKNMASDTALLDTLSQGMGVFMNATSAAMGVVAQFTGNEEDAKRAVVAFTTAQSTLNTLTQLGNALQKQSSLMLGIRKIQEAALTKSIAIRTAAENKGTAATVGATIAQKAFNVVAKANPYVLLATAVLAVGAAFLVFSKNAKTATDEQKKLTEAEENAKKASEQYAQTLASEFSKLMTSYTKLKATWTNLANDTQRKKFIDDHKTELKNLGVEIKNVHDAEEFFNKNTAAVVDAFKRRAQAAAVAAKLTQLYMQQMDILSKHEDWQNNKALRAGDIVKGVSSFTKDKNSNTYNEGRFTKGNDGTYRYTDKGAEEANRNSKPYQELNEAYKENTAEIEKNVNKLAELSKGLHSYSDEVDNTDKKVKKDTTTKKQEINTISEAVNEYDSLVKKKAELNKYLTEGRVSDEGLQQLKDEMAGYDKKIQELVDKWHINPAPIEVEVKPKALSFEDILGGNFNQTISGYSNAISELQKKMQDTKPGDEKWEEYANKIKEYKEALNELEKAYNEKLLTPQELALKKFDELQEAAEKMGATFGSLGDTTNAMGNIFKAMGEDAAAAAMEVITATMDMVAQIIPQIASLIGAKQAEAMASGTASAAKLPFPANLGAIASIIATVLSTFATIANVMSSAGKHANGGIVGGSSYHGDKIWARLDSGEMVLNSRQQRNLFNMLDMGLMPQRGGTNVTVQGVIRGTDLMLVQKNTSKVLSKTGNKIIF